MERVLFIAFLLLALWPAITVEIFSIFENKAAKKQENKQIKEDEK